MFINKGGLHEQHRPHRGKLHLQPQRHHYGHRHPQQFNQRYQPNRSRRLAARRHRLLPGTRHHGSVSPAALLLDPTATSSHHPTQSNRIPIPIETTRLTWTSLS